MRPSNLRLRLTCSTRYLAMSIWFSVIEYVELYRVVKVCVRESGK